MTELDREPARLNGIEPTVVSFDVVVILLRLAVIAKHSQPRGHIFVVRGNRTTLSESAEILAWIEAERCGFSDGPSVAPGLGLLRKILRAVRLASVFDDHQIVFLGQ